MAVDIWILNKQFKRICVIDYYTSLIWAKRYNELGDCELYVAASPELIDVLKIGNYIEREDDDMICKIEKVEITTSEEEGDYITATGYSLAKMLWQRIILEKTYSSPSMNIEVYLRQVVSHNLMKYNSPRAIPLLTLGHKNNFTETGEEESPLYEAVGDIVQKKCKELKWGYRIIRDKMMYFELYKGEDKRATVVFSDDFENLVSTHYTQDFNDACNTPIIVGENTGIIDDYTITGLDRFEKYIDLSNIGTHMNRATLYEYFGGGNIVQGQREKGHWEYEDVYIIDKPFIPAEYRLNGERVAVYSVAKAGEDDEATLLGGKYLTLLKSLARTELLQQVATTEFEGQIDTGGQYVYKRDFNLGDLIIIKNKYNIISDARIVEVIETFDENGYTLEPKFEYTEGLNG